MPPYVLYVPVHCICNVIDYNIKSIPYKSVPQTFLCELIYNLLKSADALLMELFLLQILLLFCLLIITLVGSFAPFGLYCLKSEKCDISWGKILYFGNCLASGAFFAMCFFHLVPNTQQKWTNGQLISILFHYFELF